MPRFARNDGFTLAETLITLVIIGVIAAITVPSLIQKTQNQEYVSRLKKAYSTLSQATNMIIAEEGSPKNNWIKSSTETFNLYKKHLLNSKECGATTNCFKNGQYKGLNGNISSTNTWNENVPYTRLILADGSLVIINFLNEDCNDMNRWSGGSNNVCGYISVDVNGEKKPNQHGRDLFWFVIKEHGLYPMGCDVDDINTVCNTSKESRGCACKVLREGAMNY